MICPVTIYEITKLQNRCPCVISPLSNTSYIHLHSLKNESQFADVQVSQIRIKLQRKKHVSIFTAICKTSQVRAQPITAEKEFQIVIKTSHRTTWMCKQRIPQTSLGHFGWSREGTNVCVMMTMNEQENLNSFFLEDSEY